MSETEIKVVPDHISTYYLSRMHDGVEQAMTEHWVFEDVPPEGVASRSIWKADDVGHRFLLIDSRYAAYMALQGWLGGMAAAVPYVESDTI